MTPSLEQPEHEKARRLVTPCQSCHQRWDAEALLSKAEQERDELKALCHDADAETMMYVERAEASERKLERLRARLRELEGDAK